METKNNDIIMQNRVFAWIAIGTLLLLSVPFSLMRFKIPLYDPGSGYEAINWTMSDFVVMGLLIFGFGSFFVFAARKVQKKYRITIAFATLFLFLWLWVELAVGLFTSWGS